jgi:hypothetical protein
MVEIPERATERGLGRNGRALVIDPGPQVVEDRPGLALPALPAFVCGVAGELGGALDGEQASDLVQSLERDHDWYLYFAEVGLDDGQLHRGIQRSSLYLTAPPSASYVRDRARRRHAAQRACRNARGLARGTRDAHVVRERREL